MTPGDNPYIYQKERREAESGWKFPFGGSDSDQEPPETDSEAEQPEKGPEQRNPMAGDDVRFREILHHMQEMSQRLVAMEIS